MPGISQILRFVGFDLATFVRTLAGVPRFFAQKRAYEAALAASGSTDFPVRRITPYLTDHSSESGVASGAYFHQDIWVAREIHRQTPQRHLDIASRVDGFVAHVAVFRQIDVADIRVLSTTARNINFVRCDVMDPAQVAALGTYDSVSCLHALEHFGLGRYGDPIDPDGHLKGLANIASRVAPGGRLYLSVPLGPQGVEFNGQRVYHARTLPALLADRFALETLAYIDDRGDMHEPETWSEAGMADDFGCRRGCIVYAFRRGA